MSRPTAAISSSVRSAWSSSSPPMTQWRAWPSRRPDDLVQRGLHGADLGQHVDAVAVVLDITDAPVIASHCGVQADQSPGAPDHVQLLVGEIARGGEVPAALGDVAGLPRLLDALRADGFTADEIARIAWGNWRRVLGATWR